MSKQIKAKVRMQLKGAAATPAPPVSVALGPLGVSLMDFCKKFNEQTADRKGEIVPIVVTVYTDRSYEFVTKTPPASELIKKYAKISKGVSAHRTQKAGTISMSDIEQIAKIKMTDLNAFDIEAAKKIIAGSARSMGVQVVE